MDYKIEQWSGKDLKAFREKFTISKASLARALDCTPVRIYQIEKDDLQLSNSMIRRIRRAFFTSCSLIEKA